MPRFALHAFLVTLLVAVLGVAQGMGADTASATASTVTAVRAAPATPGCDPQQHQAPDSRQGVPSRGTSAHELLAPLVYAHGHGATAVFDSAIPPTPAGRGPPPLDPPSPVELSVLRV
ncbi:hypothetical protein [Streptomyces sp. NPDC052225]|uniref:hypothetical protein n=1 Tax=Streptomyces sp. NPDC052225 TaxID=3154949 RepID=UPI003421F378